MIVDTVDHELACFRHGMLRSGEFTVLVQRPTFARISPAKTPHEEHADDRIQIVMS